MYSCANSYILFYATVPPIVVRLYVHRWEVETSGIEILAEPSTLHPARISRVVLPYDLCFLARYPGVATHPEDTPEH